MMSNTARCQRLNCGLEFAVVDDHVADLEGV